MINPINEGDHHRPHLLSFTIFVTANPTALQAANTAYRFCKAALDKSHTIKQVFFYLDAVTTGASLSPPSDETNLTQCWQTLSLLHGFELHLCIAAANRRGVMEPVSGFKLTGLGQFMEASSASDRLMIF